MNENKIIILVILLIFSAPLIGCFMLLTNLLGERAIIIIPIILLIILVIIFIKMYNTIISLKQKIKQAEGTVDVYLKKRFDLIPNLVETVKGYKNYEESILEKVTQLRSDYEKKQEGNVKEIETLNDRLSSIIAIVENYPELKSSEQFLNLQKNLSKVESELQAARRIYNSEVTNYNTTILKFPSNIIANIFGFKEKPLFTVESDERKNVKIDI